jgi:cell division protein FtsN
MVGEEQTNKTDLRATPDEASTAAPEQEAAQKDAPLPAFIYGRDGSGRGGDRSGDRQNFNARIADMDRKTLLGLVTGAGMLGLVLFFAGMLVGAGLFMDSNDPIASMPDEKAPVEMLATAPDEPVMTDAVPEPADQAAKPETVSEIVENSDDPVGELIAQRSAALDGGDVASGDENAVAETAEETATSQADAPALSAPEIRDVGTAPAAPAAPAVDEAPTAAAPDAEVTETAEAPAAPAAEPEAPTAETAETTAEAPAPEAEEPAAEAAAATSTSADTPFSVQVGAFKVQENASQRAEDLRKLGLQVAVVVRGPEDDAAWYYVRIGAYSSIAQARDSAAKIKSDHSIDGFPVRAEPNDREVN